MLDSLLDKLTKYFPKTDKKIIKKVSTFALGIIKTETVCLNKVKNKIGEILEKPKTQSNSHYKGLIRFIRDESDGELWFCIISSVIQMLRLKIDHLILDGTKWKKGENWIHYMTLCVLYKGVAIPIYWTNIDKNGISNEDERIRLIQEAMKLYSLTGKILLADREYIGKEFFNFLINNKINFIVRLKKSTYKKAINASKGSSLNSMIDKVCKSKVREKTVGKRVLIEGMELNLAVAKNRSLDPKDPVVILLSNLDLNPKKLANRYDLRWKIEECFKHLKSNGFNLEKLNVKGENRRRLVISILVFAYAISIMEGMKDYDKIRIIKDKKGKEYKEVSIFRNGYSKITEEAFNLIRFCRLLLSKVFDDIPKYRNENFILSSS